MKKFFSSIFVVLIFITTTNVFSQTGGTYVSFPLTNPGKDAIIKYSDPNTPFGTFTELVMSAWKVNGELEIIRSLIEFDDLSTIPTNALVGDARFFLNGISTPSAIIYQQGNSYPSTIYPTNEVDIERIKSPWNQNTVTWNTQPPISSNPANVPFSNSQWLWNYIVNSSVFIAMVQDMVTNPNGNFGFMLKLQNENAYRHMIFGSSDNPEIKYRPTLGVRYYVPEFTYCFSASDVYTYTFTPEDIAGCNHEWLVDGVLVSNSAIFTYTFVGGTTYQICHRITVDNIVYRSKCVTICVY